MHARRTGSVVLLALLAAVPAAAQSPEEAKQYITIAKDTSKSDQDRKNALTMFVRSSEFAGPYVADVAQLLDDPKLGEDPVFALRNLGPVARPAAPALCKVLNGPGPFLRHQVALQALEKSGASGKEVVSTLTAVAAGEAPKATPPHSADQVLELRRMAVKVLGGLRGEAKPAVPTLLTILKGDSGSPLQPDVLYALGKIGPDPKEAMPAINPYLTAKKPGLAEAAAKAKLMIERDPAAIKQEADRLVERLKNKGDRLGRIGAEDEFFDLGELAKPAVPQLAEMLSDADHCYHVLRILSRLGPDAREAVPGLLKMLKENKAAWGQHFIPALQLAESLGVPPKELVPAMTPVVEDALAALGKNKFQPINEYQVKAIQTIGRAGPDAKSAVPVLLAVLKKHQEGGGIALGAPTIEALGKIGPDAKDALELLAVYLKPDSDPIRNLNQPMYSGPAKVAIARINGREPEASAPPDKPKAPGTPAAPDTKVAEPAGPPPNKELLAALSAKDEAGREEAAGKLLKMGAGAVPTLQAGLKAEAAEVRVKVALTLAKLGGDAKAAVPALTAALKDPAPEVRREAAAALAALGPAAKAAAPALAELLQGPDREARLLAAYALEKVQGAK
jgi:HEAT repeat protein